MTDTTTPMYYIASLKHTNKGHEHITFWGKDHRGYTLVFGDYIGQYTLEEAVRLNDGFDCLAVPCDEVHRLLVAEPYYRRADGQAARFYDQRGGAVLNDSESWHYLLKHSLKAGRHHVPKPETFKGRRRSFGLPQGVAA